MNVDFKARPFFLDESDIAWVPDCMKTMTEEEKVSHLFCILIKDKPVEEMAAEMDALGFYPGGYMTDVFPARKVKENFKKLQARTGTVSYTHLKAVVAVRIKGVMKPVKGGTAGQNTAL